MTEWIVGHLRPGNTKPHSQPAKPKRERKKEAPDVRFQVLTRGTGILPGLPGGPPYSRRRQRANWPMFEALLRLRGDDAQAPGVQEILAAHLHLLHVLGVVEIAVRR